MTTDTALDAEFQARAQRILDRINYMLNEDYAQYGPRSGPSWEDWRQFTEAANGHVYGYTVKADADGWYYATDHKPVGKGARSGRGKAQQWTLTRATKRRQRKDAKAIAVRWWEAARTQK